MAERDVVIIGAGMAGLTAATFAARFGLTTTVLDQTGVGGQIATAETVENVPGFPDGLSGAELGPVLHEQADAAGAEIELDTVLRVEVGTDGDLVVVGAQTSLATRSVIIAAGSAQRSLGIPGEDTFLGKGVSHCASCDGGFFSGRPVGVVGGGDSALDEALVLRQFTDRVTVFHRGAALEAQHAVIERANAAGLPVELNTTVAELRGDGVLSTAVLAGADGGARREVELAGLFVYVGQQPNSAFLSGLVDLDAGGHINTDIMMATSRPGIFAAGDIRAGSVAQLAAAAGDGATAAIGAYRYLSTKRQ